MERLTHRYTDGEAWASIYKVFACGEHECKGPIIERLAAYEDIGIEPNEIRSLLQTGAGGLYKKLPCKEGDPVWWIGVNWLPGNGKMYRQIESGKFRYAMLDWQNPVYTTQADAEAALADMANADKKEGDGE